jgi:ABC-type Na+ efflux pump permease subunit
MIWDCTVPQLRFFSCFGHLLDRRAGVALACCTCRSRYKPALRQQVFIVPGVPAFVLRFTMTFLSIIRSFGSELGTLEQLVVSPVRSSELTLGKLMPLVTTGCVTLAMVLLLAVVWIVRGIIIKGVGIEYLWPQILLLALFGAVVFTTAVLRFRKRID